VQALIFSFALFLMAKIIMNMAIIHVHAHMFPLDVWGFPEKQTN